ncbi:MAG: permease [Deferribacterales bacterium]
MNTDTESMQKSDGKLYIYALKGAVILVVWYLLYKQLQPLSSFITFDILRLSRESHIGDAVSFFLYDVPKIFMLLTLVVYCVGIINTFFTPERTRSILAGRYQKFGNVLAAVLGIVTPFCSCSAIPLFLGFVTAGIPLGVTFSFLISAPMVNEVALVMLFGLFGWKIAALYLATGLGVAIVSGWVIGALKMERYLEDWVQELQKKAPESSSVKLTWQERLDAGKESVINIVGKVWVYIIIGIAIGGVIHGFVPEGLMAEIMGKDTWWSVPAAVLIGVPMYSNAAGIIPVVQALMGKGASLGPVLAFMMSVIALSLPEIMILKKVLKPRLIMTFVGIVAGGILFVGYLFNIVL